MPRKPALSPLAARLDQLNITVEDCGAVCGVPVEVVTDWIENGPDAAARVRLRWLDDAADALRRVNHHRGAYQGDMRGAGINYAGIGNVPYGGGFTGSDAEAPQ